MQEIRKILVPVDFQQYTDELAEFAVAMANKLAAKLTFFHVVENVVIYADFIPTYLPQSNEETLTYAKKRMGTLIETSKKTWMGCTGEVSRGDVVDTIADYAKDEGMDLIIIGTHGAKGLERILLGSVAERVIKRCSCPALIFKPQKS
ncbi:MAG: universal stress protein [Desulfoprunum sp.]|nr:universal stress protein [Desulfoprunum sp.]